MGDKASRAQVFFAGGHSSRGGVCDGWQGQAVLLVDVRRPRGRGLSPDFGLWQPSLRSGYGRSSGTSLAGSVTSEVFNDRGVKGGEM